MGYLKPSAPPFENNIEEQEEILDNESRQEPELSEQPLNDQEQVISDEEAGPHPEYVKKLEKFNEVCSDRFHPEQNKVNQWFHELNGAQANIESAAESSLVVKIPIDLARFKKIDPKDKNPQKILLEINESNFEALKTILEAQPLSHCINVGILGSSRGGKSYIMSRLFDKKVYYSQDASTKGHTDGVVVGAKKLIDLNAIMIGLDNEGTGDPGKPNNEETELILGAINFLMCDILIINYNRVINSSVLKLLRTISHIGPHLVTKDATKHFTPKDLAKWSPVLIFTGRDYTLGPSEEVVKQGLKSGSSEGESNAVLSASENDKVKEFMTELDALGKLHVMHFAAAPEDAQRNKLLRNMADTALGYFGSDIYRFQALVMKIAEKVLSSRQREQEDSSENAEGENWKKERMHMNTKTFCILFQDLVSKVQGKDFKINVFTQYSLVNEETSKIIGQKLIENLQKTLITFKGSIPIKTEDEFKKLTNDSNKEFIKTITEIGEYSPEWCHYILDNYDGHKKLMTEIENENKGKSTTFNRILADSCMKEFEDFTQKQKSIKQDDATKITKIVEVCDKISSKFTNGSFFAGEPSITDFQKNLDEKKNGALMGVFGLTLAAPLLEKLKTLVLDFGIKRTEYYKVYFDGFGLEGNGPTPTILQKSVPTYLKENKSKRQNYYEDLKTGIPISQKQLKAKIEEHTTATKNHLKADFGERCKSLHSELNLSAKSDLFNFCIEATCVCETEFDSKMKKKNENAADVENSKIAHCILDEMKNFKSRFFKRSKIYKDINQKKKDLTKKIKFYWCDGSMKESFTAKKALTKTAAAKKKPYKSNTVKKAAGVGATGVVAAVATASTFAAGVGGCVVGGALGAVGGPVVMVLGGGLGAAASTVAFGAVGTAVTAITAHVTLGKKE